MNTTQRNKNNFRIYTGSDDIDEYIHIDINTINEILLKDMKHIYILFKQYLMTVSHFLPVAVIDCDFNFADFLKETPDNDLINYDNVYFVLPDKPMENLIDDVIKQHFPVLFITNIGLLLSEKQYNTPKFDRADFAQTVFGVYRYIFNKKVPYVIIGNISWSREIGKISGKDSPGGEFRKMMVKHMYKIETVESKKRHEIINIITKKGKKKEKHKTLLDKKKEIYLPVISASKLNKDPKKMIYERMKEIILEYDSYFKESDFIRSVLR